ncbi:MAG: hypothetical protein J7480_05030, partial [Microbacteriaceae bacterium]|nr:hypothetical protein [Microbacteriaceae bacterium]
MPASRGPSSAKRGARPRDAERAPRGSSGQRGSRPGDPDRGVDARPKAATRPAGAPKPPKDTAGADARREAAHARAEARRAAAERRRYERAEIKDAVQYLTFLVNPQDGTAFTRIANSPKR